ncbi:MAG: CusA/CzcA family heavy metal efflux RND transporter [Deltaproteobacteria bacterium]
MLEFLIKFSLKNKLIIILFTITIIGFGIYSLTRISIGAVPDITNNQIQVISTSKNLATQDVEKFITYPVELEMANLPGVREIRSVSKFGLSVVTVVFNDNMGTYLPRQLLAEKLKSASEKIPQGYGVPQMGPITTGLGEVYQYTLEVKEPYKNLYSPMDLRTIQDWIVKRQLSGLPGVVEINTWGGFLKQYEVAVDIDKMKAMNIEVNEVFSSLEKNNSVAGGGYIEKNNQAYFVRGEGLLKNADDIRNTVVSSKNGAPVMIRDIAEVQIGNAPRFGAITGNGEGEKVLGQIMMIKNGNSKKTIEGIKSRIEEVQKSLPEGVYINGFLDRSELIGKTTFTVEENLLLGSLIVIFIVVLLLGNLRSGLVVASVIPLSLLFTISMMNIFKIDANLMSLGAIDFGIIIDGAVIIVEFIAFKISSNYVHLNQLSKVERQEEIDKITFRSANKMMNSAIFGQLIILIVFIPILSLRGVEGKMFTPMALSFSFALIGAMILCFTYVPVISSMFLKPVSENPKDISSRIMAFLTAMYLPVIKWCLNNKKLVMGSTLLVFVTAMLLFSRMGGEFVPTLDEGDFVVQPVLKTGTSLSKTIEITTQIEKILLDKFPEVDQVISRIGAAEVPTDPMSMEESDVIIKLKPRKEWVSAKSKDELADKFKEALLVIPGIDIEFTQPIEMRFNELITGVRSDVAVKIFGDDLDILSSTANQIKNLINKVEGASDITVEKVSGLPQMSVMIDKQKIAKYGLNSDDVNNMITSGFSGQVFGTIFEGEKQFDLVMRLKDSQRNDITDLENLWIDSPVAGKIPLSEVAVVSYSKGPAKISRDNTRRRVVIGINVRNRDMQSVVDEVSKIVESKVKLPTGYYIEYGGQFENLKSAKARLAIALPVALILIFILLHFAFRSIKEALMVYTAIPLAAVGGIYLLWIRGLPFSISAGVGFIALFGIAVLNGIVLIEHLKELKEHGIENIHERIIKGTTERLRPVILTAMAAALGFLPMAISTSAGAEVQRPLATVVIGGLITSTLLTMIFLPILYSIFDTRTFKIMKKGSKSKLLTIAMIFIFQTVSAQKITSADELISIALQNNAQLKIKEAEIQKSNLELQASTQFDNAFIYFNRDNNNFAVNDKPLNVLGIEQSFSYPSFYKMKRRLFENTLEMHKIDKQKVILQLSKNISSLLNQLTYLRECERIYSSLDTLYTDFVKNQEISYSIGESNKLHRMTSVAKLQNLQIVLKNVKKEILMVLNELKYLTNTQNLDIAVTSPIRLKMNPQKFENTPGSLLNSNRMNFDKLNMDLNKKYWLPDLSFTVFGGTNSELNKIVPGFQIGVQIPVLFSGKSKMVQSYEIQYQISQSEGIMYEALWNKERDNLLTEIESIEKNLDIIESHNKELAVEILKEALMNYKIGEMDFFDFMQSLENIKEIELSFVKTLYEYNQKIIELNYLN